MTNTILLADDSVTIQKVIELTFMDEDYEVVAVGNGDEALDRLEEVTPDVVIADVHMPGASGYDVARRAKQLHPQAPVLLLVGTFEPFDEADYQASGADAYLKKPFDSQELLHRVSELMVARAGMAPSPADETAAASAGVGDQGPAPGLPTPAPPGDETRYVPTWEERSGSWQPPSEQGAGAGGLGTQLVPTFGDETPGGREAAAPLAGGTAAGTAGSEGTASGAGTDIAGAGFAAGAAAGQQESAWSGWGGASAPEEVASPAAPSEEGEPDWAAGEPFEPSWESAEVEERAEETPSWSLDDTEEEPAPAAPAAATPASAGAPRDGGDPFPELSRPQPSAQPPSTQPPSAPSASAAASSAAFAGGAVSGVPGPASSAGAAGDGREARLSDDDVDRVARRVAELLGDKVLREVAWEVVPDLAEVVIKDRLRELESQVD